MNQLESFLNTYFGEKAPKLPDSVRHFIAQIAPWLVILGVIGGLFAVLSVLSAGAYFAAALGAYGFSTSQVWMGVVFSALTSLFGLLALPGLFKKNIHGWRWIFYASLLNTVYAIISLSVSSMIGTLIGWYFLFQVRPLYLQGITPTSTVPPAGPGPV